MGSSVRLTGVSILVVEDEPLIALEVTSVFQSAGAQVVAARTCREGLLAIERHRVVAAVLDYALVGDSVAPLCRALAERQIPFMFYSGYIELERSYPTVVIVQKPARGEALLATHA
jgi:DNA-binding response OmpR family regulator